MDLDWQQDAACIDKTWMAQRGNTLQAIRVCQACPVLGPCTIFAFSEAGRGIPGVLAGLSSEDRGLVECTTCGVIDWKKHTRSGLCWRCYKAAKEALAA